MNEYIKLFVIAILVFSIASPAISLENYNTKIDYFPTEGSGGGPNLPNRGTATANLFGNACGANAACSFSGTINSVCTYANTEQVRCQYNIVKTTGVQQGIKASGYIDVTGNCTTTGAITFTNVSCVTAATGSRCLTGCMTLQLICWNTTTNFTLINAGTVTFNCGA